MEDDVAVPSAADGVVVAGGATTRDEGFGFGVAFAVMEGVDTFVRLRSIDECGVPLDSDVSVDGTGKAVSGPAAAPLPDGGFVVAWSREDAPGDGEGAGVLFHRYDLDAVPRGGTTLANDTTFDDQLAYAAAGLPDGFALAWEDHSADAATRPDAVFRTYDETGDPASDEEAMDVEPTQDESRPVLGAAPDGALLLGWSADGLNARGRRRASDGSYPEFWPFALIDYETYAFTTGAAGSEDGFAAAVTWFGEDLAGDVELVLVPFEGETLIVSEVSAVADYEEFDPLVAPLADGAWFVAWTDRTGLYGVDTSGTTVVAQRFDDLGVATDWTPFVVPTTIDSDQYLVALAAGAGGTLVVWLDASGADRDGGLRARLIPHDFAP